MDAKEKRELLAKADFCRAFIHINGFLTDTENDKVFQRISKWQDKHKVSITEEQIFSVDMTYDDNANEEKKA